jgi:hypothetical protein
MVGSRIMSGSSFILVAAFLTGLCFFALAAITLGTSLNTAPLIVVLTALVGLTALGVVVGAILGSLAYTAYSRSIRTQLGRATTRKP